MLATVQCTSSGMELEDYFQEELEAVQSKFSEEFSVSEGTDGCRLVQYRSMGDLVLTIQLHHATYPNAVPVMVLADHQSTVGLWEHLHDSIKDLVGSPMLFQLFTTTCEWIKRSGDDTSALTAERDKVASLKKNGTIYFGVQRVTELYVFDFDGTLFIGPSSRLGPHQYEKCTGKKWPHKSWVGSPESLLPPMKIKIGPSLVDYRRHCGRAGSITIVLTARSTCTEPGIRTVLEDHQLYPDLLILKPEEKRISSEFKVDSLANLLKQFPDVEFVKFWDDQDGNLEAVRQFSKRCENSKIKFEINDTTSKVVHPQPCVPKCIDSSSILGSYIFGLCGLSCTEERMAAAQSGIQFIAAQFCAVVGFQGDPYAITLVFGSHARGMTGNVDLCLLAPPPLAHIDCIEKLAEQLEKCAVTHLHKGCSTRCPRLKVLLQFKDTPSIDYNIVFALLSSSDAFFECGKSSAEASGHDHIEKLLSSSDHASKTALSGYSLLCKVQETIKGFIPHEKFAALVEMTIQVLRAQRKKGNYCNYIRNSHIILLLTDFVNFYKSKTGYHSIDEIFEQFVTHTAQLSPLEWQEVFQDIATEHVPQFSDVFKRLSQCFVEYRSISYWYTLYYEDMLVRPVFPPSGYTPACLLCSGGDHIIKWKLRAFLEDELPTFIQHLLSSGLDVVLDGNGVQDSFCFAVQGTDSAEETVQLVFRKFWNEFLEFWHPKEIKLELKFGTTLVSRPD